MSTSLLLSIASDATSRACLSLSLHTTRASLHGPRHLPHVTSASAKDHASTEAREGVEFTASLGTLSRLPP
eukprot:3121770-Rhodomonas_salina.5